MRKILIVEDELAISKVLKAYLLRDNFLVDQAFNGEEALIKIETNNPNLILLDIMLPDIDGWEILKFIREKGATPVIMLTALGQVNNKLAGLNKGADDYITKPFNPEEVVARVNAVLRRIAQPFNESKVKYFGSLKVDYQSHSVYLHGVQLSFSPRDLSLFLFLTKHPKQTLTRDQLIEHVWGIDYDGSDRAVDLAIKRIRKILKNWPSYEGEIKTLRGLGYQFCVYP